MVRRAYHIRGSSLPGRIDRSFDPIQDAFVTPIILGDDVLNSGWLACD